MIQIGIKVMDYWIAVDFEGELPEGMESLEIVWKQIYSEWFPSSGYTYAGTSEFKFYSGGGYLRAPSVIYRRGLYITHKTYVTTFNLINEFVHKVPLNLLINQIYKILFTLNMSWFH